MFYFMENKGETVTLAYRPRRLDFCIASDRF